MPEGFAHAEKSLFSLFICPGTVAAAFSALSWTGLAHFWSNHWKFSALLLEFPIHLRLPATFPQGSWSSFSSKSRFPSVYFATLSASYLEQSLRQCTAVLFRLQFLISLVHFSMSNTSSETFHLCTSLCTSQWPPNGKYLRKACYLRFHFAAQSEVQKRCSTDILIKKQRPGNKRKQRNNAQKPTRIKPCTSSRRCALGRLAVAVVTTSPSALSLFPTRPSTSWSEVS